MVLTRRLSLTLLVVAPLIAAQDQPEPTSEERDPAQKTMEDIRDMFGVGDWGWGWGWGSAAGQEEEEESYSGRGRRSVETPGEDMETAEQILFRPLFRHHQLVEEREQRRRVNHQGDQLRRQSQEWVAQPQGAVPLAPQHQPLRPVPLQHRYTQGERPIKTTAIGAVVFRPQGHPSYHPHSYYYSLQ